MASDLPDAALRLSDLRRAHAADATLENLLNILSTKIQACSRLAVFEYEAGSEGHETCAATFRILADAERQSFNTLLACLRQHLKEMPDAGQAERPDAAQGGSA